VNEALVAWLMTAPDAPDERLTLGDFLARPAWHQRAACWGADPIKMTDGLPVPRLCPLGILCHCQVPM
jgi:hypothetical protein